MEMNNEEVTTIDMLLYIYISMVTTTCEWFHSVTVNLFYCCQQALGHIYGDGES